MREHPKNTEKAEEKAVRLPAEGVVRLDTVLRVWPVSASTWWDGVRSGRYPKPIKLGPRAVGWDVRLIRALIEKGV